MPTNIELWAAYAKDRFDSAVRRVDEFRNWARQLGTAVAVLVGLELTLVGRAVDLKPPFDRNSLYGCLATFLVAIVVQLWLLFELLKIGYVGRKLFGPESPVTLWPHVANQAETDETMRIFGAYHAKAHDEFHSLGEELGGRLGVATRRLAFSMVLFFVGVVLFVSAAILPDRMTESTKQPGPDPALPSAPSTGGDEPSAPETTLPTPTSGLPTTADHKPPLSTPTRGLDMTKTFFPLTPSIEK